MKATVNASLAWREGHFPYNVCGASDGILPLSPLATSDTMALRPVTVLMVTDSKYAMRIPAWAAEVKGLGFPCAVGDVGSRMGNATADNHTSAASIACKAAKAAGCECFPPPERIVSSGYKWDQNGPMVSAVRWRFSYARQLLMRGRSVLMHDADVFIYRGGLTNVWQWIKERHRASPIDFAVQNNRARPEAFDDLNWGFVWMSGSTFSTRLLGCTLDAWMHHAFLPPPNSPRSGYHMRSQPRINHIVEAATAAAPTVTEMPRVCMFSADLVKNNLRHLSGFVSAKHKLMCARAEGVLDDPDENLRGRLLFSTRQTATVDEQNRALAAAIFIGESLQLGVAIPHSAAFLGKLYPFCLVFQAYLLPRHRMTRSVLVKARRSQLCASAGYTNVSALLAPVATVASLRRRDRLLPGGLKSADLPVTCVRFDELVQAYSRLPPVENHTWLGACDPRDKRVHSAHACHGALLAVTRPRRSRVAPVNATLRGNWSTRQTLRVIHRGPKQGAKIADVEASLGEKAHRRETRRHSPLVQVALGRTRRAAQRVGQRPR